LPPGGPVVAYVGRLAPEKELTLLLRAWPSVEAASSATLLVMGDGPLAPVVKRFARDHRVHQTPFQQDRSTVADVLAAVDLVVTPGSIETFGLAQLEAMASGAAVVAPRTGGAGEMVSRSGGGRRFLAGEPSDLARTVAELLSDAAAMRHLGNAGRAYAERHCSWDHVFDTLFAMYGRLRQCRTATDDGVLLKRWSAPRIERRTGLYGDHV
jgi:phosphatidylinositol alpha 1,6-mannosyltransferase